MKNMFSPWAKLAAVAACALSLGSCNRAEYALLPKSAAPYHGGQRAATLVPVAVAPVAAPSTPAPVPTVPARLAAKAPAPSPSAPAVVAASPAAAPPAAEPAVAAEAAPVRKPNALQRLALKQATRKLDKMLQKSTARRSDNTASTQASGISGNLRTGLILLLVGVLVGLIIPIVGTIIAIIGLVFIILWLLDQA